jgi:hypothetical protein
MSVEDHWSGSYRDDRMYVMRITSGATRSGPVDSSPPEAPGEFVTGPTPASGGWVPSVSLMTYRNVPSLPAVRVDSFESIEKAIEYVKKVEPTCPRVSLNGQPPEPTPSWEEHIEWLHRLGLRSAAEGDEAKPD